MIVFTCPKCNGTNILVEKRLNGFTTCGDCGFSVNSADASVFHPGKITVYKPVGENANEGKAQLLVEG